MKRTFHNSSYNSRAWAIYARKSMLQRAALSVRAVASPVSLYAIAAVAIASFTIAFYA